MLRRISPALLTVLLLSSTIFTHSSLAQGGRYFPQTGYSVDEPFLSFWQQGSIELYGYPISPAIQQQNPDDGQVYTMQYFERARLELHPDSTEPIELGRLGAARLAQQPALGTSLAQPVDQSCLTFTETRHMLCGELAAFWRERGGLAIFGFPLTPPLVQTAPDGNSMVVQYTERGRFELDPASGGVSLGLLGREIYVPGPEAAPKPLPLDPVDAQLVELINQERAAAGLAPVAVSLELMAAAAGHSLDMATSGLISHSGSDGRGAAQRMRDAGYTWARCGENIAVSYATPELAMAFWMSSPPHRANILDPQMQEVGVSHLAQPGGWGHYWTMDLGVR